MKGTLRSMKPIFIKCPHCGGEYLPNEIFVPKIFFGNATNIVRELGTNEILEYDGENMNLKEQYICDFCDTPFLISTKLTFTTKEDVENDFSEEYKTPYIGNQIFLNED